MAAYLNRTISMVTGNGTSSTTTIPQTSPTKMNTTDLDLGSENRSLSNANAEQSPLQVFVRAKKKINDIDIEIEEYVLETTQFINGGKYEVFSVI